jgi:F1F0 ATPase subunit 2
MTDIRIYLDLVASLFAGVGLAVLYFGGLWLTVRRLPRVRRPALLLSGSFMARIVVFLAGLFLVTDGRPELLAVCLGGFLCCRVLLIQLLGRMPRCQR